MIKWFGTNADIEDRKRSEELLDAEKRVLQLIASDESLPNVLNDLCVAIDNQAGGAISAILLTDSDGKHLSPGAGPRFPEGLKALVSPLAIGPQRGACGTAAFLKERVIISDIAIDSRWPDEFRDLAAAHGLRAAWSEPLISSSGEVLGTFALYHGEPRVPHEEDLALFATASNIARIAIEREHSRSAVAKSLDIAERSAGQLRSIIDTIPTLAWSMRPDGSIDYFNQQWAEYTGMPIEQALNWGWKVAKHPDDMPRILQAFERATESGEPVEVEGRIRRRDGVFRWFLIRANPLRDQSGAIVRWYGTDLDIEDRKLAETELARAFEEIKRLKDRLQDENVALREQIDRTLMFEEIVGASPALKAALSAVSRVAPTVSTVMLLGETGTGKELFARAIHKRSPRSQRTFVSINCAAIPQGLIASELFGYEKGAFTGAQQRRLGRFELADRGTLFLDEIGDLPLDTQVALLRVLQERQFERVGGTQPITADVRVIAATNRDLPAAVVAGTFRSDLFYRLNVFPIEIPPLRQRREDIPLLVEYFIDQYARKAGKKISGIDRKSMDMLRGYSWPGNIREVQNVIERAVILCDSQNLEIDKSWLSRPATPDAESKPLDPFKRISRQEQKAIIEAALRESGGRVYGPSGAAARLGIPRSTLESKIRSLSINKHLFKAGASFAKNA